MRSWGNACKHPAVIAVLAAMLGLLANTLIAILGQSYALQIEEKRNRREVVLELMRTNDREATLEKLQILKASGLLPDPDGRLQRAVKGSALSSIIVPCGEIATIPEEPAKIGRLPEDAGSASGVLAGSVIELRAYGRALRGMLEACSSDGRPASQAP